ncbi:hypothetical protein THRCLA_09598 [Thraustotheca clavata]|uniref:JmjC domain-containing protein n=1 Tax=Thraustotheca clavata TaxID=74557 RepID=A0A1V9YW27_9STRA|nr:hypothetical protein THRCLA_09598 [Thraustotheca clavata]
MTSNKRQRTEDDGSMFSGARFSFSFQQEEASKDETIVKAHPSSATICVACNIDGRDVVAGHLITIDWARSSWSQLHVTSAIDSDISGFVHPQYVALPLSAFYTTSAKPFSLDAPFWQFDYVFDRNFAGCTWPLHFSSAPLTIEPNLQSLAWPLNKSTFIQHVYNQRSFAVHGSQHRLESLLQDLHQLDVETLILTASRTVAWLATATEKKQMQYLEVTSPEMARAIYKAGHSLYFNPSPEIQEKYLTALCADLGMDFTSTLDGGIGGDIELFAVQGRHSTPWHLDAQQNITIQLTGTKRWSFCKGPVDDPMTNLHLASTNTTSVQDDLITHSMCNATTLNLQPPSDDDPRVSSVLLRPGSVLYVPAGYWHKVEAMDEGSLSMNFSIDGSRWIDVVWNRLLPQLMAQPEFRARPDLRRGPKEAREQLKAKLSQLKATIEKLQDHVDELMPKALFQPASSEPLVVEKLSATTDLELKITNQSTIQHTGFATLIPTPHFESTSSIRFSVATAACGKFSEGFKAERMTILELPKSFLPIVNIILDTTTDSKLTLSELESALPEPSMANMLYHFIELLVQHGYLKLH